MFDRELHTLILNMNIDVNRLINTYNCREIRKNKVFDIKIVYMVK